ncbi:MAG: glycosyltransferase family 2 protein [Halobaculum sp.]
MLVAIALHLGTLVGTVLVGYFLLGAVAYLVYTPQTADERADDTALVVTTVGADHVRDSLLECLAHHREEFPDLDRYILTDEGADMEAELRAYEGYETVVVPDAFDCAAVAKGRAIQYFIETVVADDPDRWYGFVDDDNLVQDDRFLYEIPYYDERGYGAMNSVLAPRKGESVVTYVMDHVRLLDDLTVFRAFTGLLGRPYVGFHGELLTARGDVLCDVGFDRHSIVEDFAFAAELVRADVRTWQSGTHVSILSPHSLRDLFRQRSRWFVGTWNLLFDASPVTRLVTGVRLGSWVLAILAGPVSTVLWHTSTVSVPPVLQVAPPLAGVVYGGTYLYGVAAATLTDRRWAWLVVLLPLFALFEALAPVYAVLVSDREFTVIEK